MQDLQDALRELIEVAMSLRSNDHKTDSKLNHATEVIKRAEKVLDDSFLKKSSKKEQNETN